MQMQYENLVGRPFILGTYDCFRTVIDFFKQNFDLDIPNFARPTNWDADDLDLISLLYKKTGFEMVQDDSLRPGDVLVTAVGSSNPNHLVIYLGDHEILHHKAGVLSSVEAYRPAWKMVTCYVLRHPLVPDLTPVLPDVSIEELLRARYSL